MIRSLITVLLFCLSQPLAAQNCTTPGQTPSTAFPVCGTRVFQQTTVPICASHTLAVPGCSSSSGVVYQDKNPYWYRFTCFKGGTLGFLIKPNNQGDDYDWQLYDITGKNPDEVFTNPSLVVTGNWAGTFGNTGASSSGVNFLQCASDPAENKNSFAAMPALIEGHTYILLVSHFTDSQSGYGLSFDGGTAVITDPTRPALKAAEASCGGGIIRLKLSKKIKCSSLAADASDFIISPGATTISAVTGIGCASGFDTDSIEFQLSAPLAPGNYSLQVKEGGDGNTLLDNCDNPIPVGDKADFTILPIAPTPMDSLEAVTCAPQSLRLVFKKPMLCSTIATNGSDFQLSGPYPVSISQASGNCTGTTTKEIILTLSQPLFQAGNFSLLLKKGSDGNTLFDECSQETPAGSSLSFVVKDTVNANFSFEKRYGCTTDTVYYFHPGANGVDSWQWMLDENQTSSQQNPRGLYQVFNQKTISLAVSNGFCSDTSSQTVMLDNFLKADFSTYEDNCPNEPVSFTSAAQGAIVQHHWSFGDGGTSADESPTYTYSQPYNTTSYTINYTVTDSIGCQSTAQRLIKIYSSCYLAVPNAFTPNNDGHNDQLRVLNAIKSEKLEFRIYNRWGQLVFKTNNWKQGWDGTFKGARQGSGVYVWFLTYTDRDSKETRTLRGSATLIR